MGIVSRVWAKTGIYVLAVERAKFDGSVRNGDDEGSGMLHRGLSQHQSVVFSQKSLPHLE